MKTFLKLVRSKDFMTSFHCKDKTTGTRFLSSGLFQVNRWFLQPLLFCPQRKTMTSNENCMQAHSIRSISWLSVDSTWSFRKKFQGAIIGITYQKIWKNLKMLHSELPWQLTVLCPHLSHSLPSPHT